MSFSTQLSTDLITVEAGDNAPLTLQVVNRGEEIDRFEVEVEGLDAEWTAIPVAVFSVAAGETQSEKIFFRVPRSSESLAGNYPFVVRVRSLNSAEARSAQGVLQIKPYNHLSMEIAPKKGAVTPVRSAEVFHASIVNLGNTEQTLQIYGSDPEDAFAFEFAQEQVSVGPGQQKDVEIRATPTNARPFSAPRLHVFTISARSIQTPSLVTSSQAQIEQRPIVTPGALVVLLVIFLIGFVWFLAKPQQPAIDVLNVNPSSAVQGDVITIQWHASHATSVELRYGDQDVRVEPSGTRTFTAEQSGAVEATAWTDRSQSKPWTASYEVKKPPVVPDAVVDKWDIKPRSLNVGQTMILTYAANEATSKLLLLPSQTVLDPKLGSYSVKADEKGTFQYWLVAENSNGKRITTKKITVSVTEASQAHIVLFDVQPREVDSAAPQVTVKWQTSNAARVDLAANGAVTNLTSTPTGESTTTISLDTEFVLTVTDENGLSVSKRIVVRVKAPPNADTGGGTGTTAGAQPTTTGTIRPPATTAGGK